MLKSESSLAFQQMPPRIHGGTDLHGKPQFDFSTNSNAFGPCNVALQQIQAADCSAYPDPEYQQLRQLLGEWHQVAPHRIVFAASASEFIYRMSMLSGLRSQQIASKAGKHDARNDAKSHHAKTSKNQEKYRTVWVPPHSYADYALAARSASLSLTDDITSAGLIWACEPGSPLGQNQENLQAVLQILSGDTQLVLDCAYQPLRLSGQSSLNPVQLSHCWQMFTPNKALGLTGIRGAYVIAPIHAEEWQIGLEQLAPSWVLGTHAVAMLSAWTSAPVQAWLQESLISLREWKCRQITLCQDLGWEVLPSHANFFCASPSALIQEYRPDFLHELRSQGIKLRHAESFGLPACFRLGVLKPFAQDALYRAVKQFSPEFF